MLVTLSPYDEDGSSERVVSREPSPPPADPMPSPPLTASGIVEGVVEAYVVAKNGAPIEGAPVLFSASAGTIDGRVSTDVNGRAASPFAPPRSAENLDVVIRAVVPFHDDSLFLAGAAPAAPAAALRWKDARIAILRTAPENGPLLDGGDLRQLSIAAVSRSETIVEPLRGEPFSGAETGVAPGISPGADRPAGETLSASR